MRNTRLRIGTALIAAVLTTLPLAPSAVADEASQQALVNRYSTLSGALLSAQAQRQSLSLNQYLKASQATVYSLPASNGSAAVSMLATQDPASSIAGIRLQASSLADLDKQLSAAKVGFSSNDYSSMESLVSAMREKSGSADALVTSAGAQWAASLGALTKSALVAPSQQSVAVPAVPKDALGFGLLLDKSITQLALNSPDILAQVQASGVGTKKGQAAWAQAMSDAWSGSQMDISSALPNACTGGMIAVMATGDASSAQKYGDCGTGCVAGGMYLHNQALGLFSNENPTVNSGLNTTGALSPLAILQDLPGGAQPQAVGSLANQPPNLNQMLSGSGSACSTASTNSTSILSSTLPSVWGGLAVKP